MKSYLIGISVAIGLAVSVSSNINQSKHINLLEEAISYQQTELKNYDSELKLSKQINLNLMKELFAYQEKLNSKSKKTPIPKKKIVTRWKQEPVDYKPIDYGKIIADADAEWDRKQLLQAQQQRNSLMQQDMSNRTLGIYNQQWRQPINYGVPPYGIDLRYP